jgi:excisionase family DNA binding protein
MSSNANTKRPPPPRVALSIEEACASLGVSWDTWREHIEPEIRLARLGRRKLVPVTELERWLERHAARLL